MVHHLFPQIPHYHLVEAVSLKKINFESQIYITAILELIVANFSIQTEAAKPVLGDYYREPKKSGPLPFYLLGALLRSMKKDHYVSDTGDIVYYQTDPQLDGARRP